jgi:hypothetical protein
VRNQEPYIQDTFGGAATRSATFTVLWAVEPELRVVSWGGKRQKYCFVSADAFGLSRAI